MKKGPIILIVVLLLVVVAVIFFSLPKSNNIPVNNIYNQNTGNNLVPANQNQGTPNNSATGSQGSQPTSHEIDISGFAFSSGSLTIKAGDIITWTNKDSATHTVTSDSGSELKSSSLSKGQTYSHTFNTAGEFDYHCAFHSGMTAKIIVQ
ncbi:cupredoxin domain-containing protein [Candidatus Pacearchaeota archaeon]|nr:cupredoxin domain-containing protein [Candidatus Pacearchaeota archaeon]